MNVQKIYLVVTKFVLIPMEATIAPAMLATNLLLEAIKSAKVKYDNL